MTDEEKKCEIKGVVEDFCVRCEDYGKVFKDYSGETGFADNNCGYGRLQTVFFGKDGCTEVNELGELILNRVTDETVVLTSGDMELLAKLARDVEKVFNS